MTRLANRVPRIRPRLRPFRRQSGGAFRVGQMRGDRPVAPVFPSFIPAAGPARPLAIGGVVPAFPVR